MSHNAGAALLTKIALTMSNPEAGLLTMFLPIAEGWDMKELAFDLPLAASGISLVESVNYRGRFARRANQIPARGDYWTPTGRILWNTFGNVFDEAKLASVPPSSADDAAVLAARNYLNGPDGPTPEYKAYKLCRSRSQTADQKVREAQLTLSTSTDPNVRAEASLALAQAQEDLAEANEDWLIIGYKQEVEDAKAVINQAYAKSPSRRWSLWQSTFNAIPARSDADGEFRPTGYNPAHVFDDPGAWIKLSLSGSEVDALTNLAPPEVLRTQDALGDAVAAAGEIDRISLEIARVDVERTWFSPELFDSRFWTWAIPGETPLSDGDSGTLPGYVIGLVLVKNIELSWKQPPSSATDLSQFRVLGNLAFTKADLSKIKPPDTVQPIPAQLFHPLKSGPAVDPFHDLHLSAAALIKPESLHLIARPVTQPQIKFTAGALAVHALGGGSTIIPPHHFVVAHDDLDDDLPSGPVSTTPPASPSPVRLVAYIVQKTPKSPNPDPALIWP